MRYRVAIFTSIIFLLICISVMAKPNQKELYQVLKQTFEDETFVNEMLTNLGVPQHLMKTFQYHYKEMGKTDIVLNGLTQDMLAISGILDGKSDADIEKVAQKFGAAWFQSKSVAGISRLAPKDQRVYFQIVVDLAKYTPNDVCNNLVDGNLSSVETQAAELRALAYLSKDKVARYLSVARRALRAEVSETPTRSSLSQTEREFAQAAYQNELEKAIEESDDLEWIGSEPTNKCLAARLAFESALQIEGAVGDWVMIMLSNDLRR